jgi:NTP pyrophosphatase (non-canonical NTP hydrolase)
MFKEAQRQVAEYDEKYGWTDDTPGQVVMHMQEELGEISRLMLRLEGYKNEGFSREALAEEITDIEYLLLKLANKFGIDVESEWDGMWPRYEAKTNRK